MRKLAVVAAVVLGLGFVAWHTIAPAADQTKLLKEGDAFPAWSLKDQTGTVVTSDSST